MKNWQLPTEEQILAALKHRARNWTKPAFAECFTEVEKYHENPPAFYLARQILHLLDAIKAGRSVRLHCVKSPRSLDSGRHYYDLLFVDEKGQIQKFWPSHKLCADLVGMDENNRDTSISKWIFSSRAIGMSRSFDASYGLMRLLSEIVGDECQGEINEVL